LIFKNKALRYKEKDLEKKGTEQNGIYEESALINQLQCAYNILQTKDPDKVITIGGDCSISQPAFDFLHVKYRLNMI